MLPRKRINQDGSRNVSCRTCGRFITKVHPEARINSVAACVLCESAQNGEQLSEEMIAMILNPDSNLTPQFGEQVLDPITKGDLTENNNVSYFLKTVRLKITAAAEAVAKAAKPESAVVARAKRKSRILDRGELESTLNKIEDKDI